MKKIIFIIVACTLIIPVIKGQDENSVLLEQPTYVHNVGGFAGASAGLGLSYRYFGQKFGIQVATTPIFASDHTYLSLGLTAMYSISQGRNTKLYGYLGNHYMYEMNMYDNYIYDPLTNTGYYGATETVTAETNITGIGLGFEIVASQRVGFNFQFGYAYYYHGTDNWNTGLDGGAGIFYKF